MTSQRGRFEHIDSYTYATAPLSAVLRKWGGGWGTAPLRSNEKNQEMDTRVVTPFSDDSLQRSSSVTFRDYARISGGLPLRVLSRSWLWQQDTDTALSSGAVELFFFFLRLSENNAKYGRMEREQQDLSLKDEGIHVSDGKCKEAVRLAFILKICFHSSVNESNKDLFIYVFILQHMFKFKIFPPICVQLLVTVCSYFYLHFFQYCRLYLIETQTILFRHCTVR